MNLIRCAHSASFLHPLLVLTPPALFPAPGHATLTTNEVFSSVLLTFFWNTIDVFSQYLGTTVKLPPSTWMSDDEEKRAIFSLDASSNFLSGRPVMSWPGRESQKLYWLAPILIHKLPRRWALRRECFFTLARLCLVFRATGLGDLCHLPAINMWGGGYQKISLLEHNLNCLQLCPLKQDGLNLSHMMVGD